MEKVHIPSELLEPNIQLMIVDWLEEVSVGDLTVDQMIFGLQTLSKLARKSGAIHAEMVTDNHWARMANWSEEAKQDFVFSMQKSYEKKHDYSLEEKLGEKHWSKNED